MAEEREYNPGTGDIQTMAAAIAQAAREKLVPQMNAAIEQQVAVVVQAALPETSSTAGQPYV